MKYLIRIFVDGYETSIQHLKDNEIKSIAESIIEYIQKERFSFAIELTRSYPNPD